MQCLPADNRFLLPFAGSTVFRHGIRHPFQIDSAMSDEDNINLRMKLAGLELEHADLGKAVEALTRTGGDLLCIQRLKKKKLALKDEIARLRVRIMPDIIA